MALMQGLIKFRRFLMRYLFLVLFLSSVGLLVGCGDSIIPKPVEQGSEALPTNPDYPEDNKFSVETQRAGGG